MLPQRLDLARTLSNIPVNGLALEIGPLCNPPVTGISKDKAFLAMQQVGCVIEDMGIGRGDFQTAG